MKKGRGSKAAAIATILFCLLLLWFHTMSLSSISRINNITATTTSSSTTTTVFPTKISQEKTRVAMQTVKSQNCQPMQRAQQVQLPLTSQISCNRTYLRYDLCSINGPTVLDPTTSTFFTMGSTSIVQVEKIKPYPRKYEDYIMAQIKELSLTSGPTSPPCKIQHDAPALVFSAGGYTGNFFHDFNDGFIPLFITASSIFPNRDFIMVVSQARDWWPSKYADLLKVFSQHPVVTLEKDSATHCFPSATLGLMSHGFMTIDHTLIPSSKTFMHFRHLLEKAYDHGRSSISSPHHRPNSLSRPRLILVSRKHNVARTIMNQEEVIQVMKEIGFDVIVFEPRRDTSLDESYALINSSHAMVGVHGAGLTHALFLRPRSMFIQVVPIGVDWAADVFFGRVARGINLEYIEYKIGVEESSLVKKYGKDNMLLKDPYALQKKGWPIEIMDIYLKEQNVKLDLLRFRKSLEGAYHLAKKFMHKEG
ncbi:Glycosyltransferase family 61 protein, putative [Theobroma cacao]|uniref:Glycosyltransferase family 61 protein, putative n=1 Tax=Theobroma cacao TaxID=3641 RepID=A0A061EBM5_THECC|nr:Glycosyltransferase family 61 protein, putative [Theobroma cacao]